MTASVKSVLDQISHNEIFHDELYFTGGTALSFYLHHRVSEDIDIVSSKALPHKKIIPIMKKFGSIQLQDENVKLEFFWANRDIINSYIYTV